MYITNIYVPKQDYSLVGVGFTFTIFAVVFVLLRLFTRIWLVRGRGLGFDDGFIVLSTVWMRLRRLTCDVVTNITTVRYPGLPHLSCGA